MAYRRYTGMSGAFEIVNGVAVPLPSTPDVSTAPVAMNPTPGQNLQIQPTVVQLGTPSSSPSACNTAAGYQPCSLPNGLFQCLTPADCAAMTAQILGTNGSQTQAPQTTVDPASGALVLAAAPTQTATPVSNMTTAVPLTSSISSSGTSIFDSAMSWITGNPLLAGGIALAVLFLFSSGGKR